MVRKGLPDKVTTFELRPEGNQEAKCAKMWGQKVRANSKCKCPEVGANLAHLRKIRKDSVCLQ